MMVQADAKQGGQPGLPGLVLDKTIEGRLCFTRPYARFSLSQ